MRPSATITWLVVMPLLAAVAAGAGEWPQFHGPNRDNRSADVTGSLKEWPQGGPTRIWEATGIGEGYSTVAVAGGRIHTTGHLDALGQATAGQE